jgi:hypothetical protein
MGMRLAPARPINGVNAEEPVENLQVYHNTIYGFRIYSAEVGVGKCSGLIFRNNICFGAGYKPIYAPTTYAPTVDHNITTDPGFINVSSDDFHIPTNSPAGGTGIDVGLTVDFDGKTRPIPPSIGAYEPTQPLVIKVQVTAVNATQGGKIMVNDDPTRTTTASYGLELNEGDSFKFTAIPDMNHTFEKWQDTKGNVYTTPDIIGQAVENIEYWAYFTQNPSVYACEIPLNGYEQDQYGNRRLNQACDPLPDPEPQPQEDSLAKTFIIIGGSLIIKEILKK